MDIQVPPQKDELLRQGDDEVNKVYSLYYKGLLSDGEKHRLVVNAWSGVKSKIEALVKTSMVESRDDLFAMIDS